MNKVLEFTINNIDIYLIMNKVLHDPIKIMNHQVQLLRNVDFIFNHIVDRKIVVRDS